MSDYFNSFNEDEDFSYLISKFEDAVESGLINETHFSEEEYDYLINHYMGEDDGDSVFMLAKMAHREHPYSVDLIIRYVDVLIVNKDYSEAIKVTEQRLATDSHNADILFLHGRALAKTGQHEEARRFINAAAEIEQEDSAEMYTTIGQDYVEEEDFENALYYLEIVYGTSPANYDVLNDLAYCYDRLGDLEKATDLYQKLIDIDPFNDYIWYNIGTIYSKIPDYDKALDAYGYALALNPSNTSALYNKAIILINNKKIKEATELFEDFLTLEPDNVQVMIALADSYLTLGENDNASVYFKRVLSFDKNSVEANMGISAILLYEKDYFSSLVHLRRVMGKEEADYHFMAEPLYNAYIETKIIEFLIYTLIALYKTGAMQKFYIGIDILLEKDEIWLDKLLEYLPKVNKDKIVAQKIKQHKEGLSN